MSIAKPLSIAINIQSEVQLFSVEPLLPELKQRFDDVKIVLDSFEDNEYGYKEMANGVAKVLKKHNLAPEFSQGLTQRTFDFYLTPYIDDYIKAKCYLKYEYGTLNIKPLLTYTPQKMERFHGFLCQSTITSSLLTCYGKTFPVDNLRFSGRKRKTAQSGKKRLLFAPTFNDQNDLERLKQIVNQLKRDYCIIVKSHHGTQYLKAHEQERATLESLADEYYGSDTSLCDLILNSDVCLFDNSSAIGEALYAKIPCAIFSQDLNRFKYGNLDTTQYQFVRDKLIPHTDTPEKIPSIINRAMSETYRKKQTALSDKIFPTEYRTGTKGYLNAIDYFLESEEARDYIAFHDEIYKARQEQLLKKNDELIRSAAIIKGYETGKLYRLARNIYKIKGKVHHVKS